MYKSYYFLNRYILELKTLVTNTKIKSCFSQEKDKLILSLKNDNDLFLEFSVNPGTPYINLREKFSRAKKNTVDVFPDLSETIIENILISKNDRIILISTKKGNLYFAIRGKFTNVFFIANDQIFSFKKEDDSVLINIKSELENNIYINDFNYLDISDLTQKPIDELRKLFPIIGKEISNEVKLRNENKSDAEALEEVLYILSKHPTAIYENDITGEIKISFDGLKIFKDYKKTLFENLIAAFNTYLSKIYFQKEVDVRLKIVSSYIEKELNRLTNKLNKLKFVIEKGSKEDEYNKIANLILINLNQIKQGDKEIEVADIYSEGNIIQIKLDPKLSPNQNVQNYFDRAKADRLNLQKSIELKTFVENKYNKLLLYKNKLSENASIEILEKIMNELKIKTKDVIKTQEDLSEKFKHYLIENKYHVFVGKDGANNDLLTTRFARQNDYWFHARSVSGSHVVLRIDNTKDTIPKSVLKKAASLAAYHSKAKTSGISPVSYTLKKYVVKKKSMPAGQVALLKEDVLLVKPEIPSECEYLTND
jgi:predicted ribosome quality control (RQC) complex YloA/Tae2 family protein